MCANCMTTLDALALQSGAALGVAGGGWARFRQWRAGWTAADRRRATHERTAEFLRSLDLAADAILGPVPAGAAPPRR